jgi:large subunit ribosomal protein L18
MDKKNTRIRRSRKARAKMRELKVDRLSIHRTSQHTYAQIISSDNSILVAVSTLQAEVKAKVKNAGNIAAATIVGNMVAEKAKEKGIESVAFDRSGFKYHGRVKALADGARDSGLNF